MVFQWYVIPVEFHWNTREILLEIPVECLWYSCGYSIYKKNSGIATVIPVEFHWNISDTLLEYQWYTTEIPVEIPMVFQYYEGDPRSNTNTSVISSTFGISKNGLHVDYDILLIL